MISACQHFLQLFFICFLVASMGPTLAHTHAKPMPTHAATNIGTDVATHAKPMPTMGASKVGTLVATQGSCQLSANVDTGGGC